MTSTAYRLTSTLLLLLEAALMLLAAEAFGAPNFRSAKIRANVPVVSSGVTNGIPVENQSLWQAGVVQGVSNGIPSNFTNAIDITSALYGADPSGVTNSATAINNAIHACHIGNYYSNMNLYVYVPPGTYFVTNSDITMKARAVIRGNANGTNSILNLAGGKIVNSPGTQLDQLLYAQHTVTAGLTRGSTNLSVTWNPSGYEISPGYTIVIGRFNSTNQFESPLIVTVSGQTNTTSSDSTLARVVVRCITTNATGLTFWPPLPGDWNGRGDGRVGPMYQSGQDHRRIGIEHLTLDMRNGTQQNGIFFAGVDESWIYRVKLFGSENRPIHWIRSYNGEIRDCVVDHGKETGSQGAGILMEVTSFFLVENNLVMRTFPHVQHNAGVGSIFAYNFMYNGTNSNETLVINHGAHSCYNLWEGNIGNKIKSDGYFGSASHDTMFRNWFHGLTANGAVNGGVTNSGGGVEFKRFTRNMALAGNIVGMSNGYYLPYYPYQFGEPFAGNNDTNGYLAPPWTNWGGANNASTTNWAEFDTNVQATVTMKGNYNFFNNTIPAAESLDGATLSNSLFRASKPSWFASAQSWPPIEATTPNAANFTNIPAGFYWRNGFWP